MQERDRLVKKLADQEESHKAALKAAQDREATLQAEFETEAAGWAEARQTLVSGYGQIEDLVDGKPPTSPSFLAVCHFGLLSDFGVPFFFFAQSISLAIRLPPTRPSRPVAKREGRPALRSRQPPAARWRNSSWRSRLASSPLTGCSAGFSVPGHRSWPPSGPAKWSLAPPVGPPTGWRWQSAALKPGRLRRLGPVPGRRWSSSRPGIPA